ncbi:MAG: hypothetical protein ACOY93_10115 [Bacillota bacterium]
MQQNRLLRAAALLVGLAMLITGCSSSRSTQAVEPVVTRETPTIAPAEKPSHSTPAAGSTAEEASELPQLPGDMAALKAALAEASPITYRIEVANVPRGVDKTAHLDAMLGSQGYPGKNEVLLLIFPADNHDIRFAMGALLFEKKISVESMLGMVRQHYFTKVRSGDPAGGLADLIRAVNQAVK